LLSENENFAFETTLATRSYKSKIEVAKKSGYQTTLLFFWLQNIELAKKRVRIRVSEGGHYLFDIYLVDAALIFDNSEENTNF